MKQLACMVCAMLIALGGYTAEAKQSKESRAIRKENRKAMRAEHRQRTKGATRVKIDHERINRENYKQRKKMDKAARKQNRGRKYDANALGNIFDGL